MRNIGLVIVLLSIGLSACGMRSASPAQQAAATQKQQQANMVLQAECQMYAAAYNLTGQQTGRAPATILKDCPNAPKQPGDFAINGLSIGNIKKSALLASSMSADAAGIKASYGEVGEEMFRKMIVRGAPQNVARQIVGTNEFVAAVQAHQYYRSQYR